MWHWNEFSICLSDHDDQKGRGLSTGPSQEHISSPSFQTGLGQQYTCQMGQFMLLNLLPSSHPQSFEISNQVWDEQMFTLVGKCSSPRWGPDGRTQINNHSYQSFQDLIFAKRVSWISRVINPSSLLLFKEKEVVRNHSASLVGTFPHGCLVLLLMIKWE